MAEENIETNDKIIFLDFDGPMIPVRAMYLPENLKMMPAKFDPCAVGMLNFLIDKSGAKLVISSTWASRGADFIATVLQLNGVRPVLHHVDSNSWRTPRKRMSSSRAEEIKWWLSDYKGTYSHWVAIDDFDLRGQIEKFVFVSMDDGFQIKHMRKAAQYLDVKLPLFLM